MDLLRFNGPKASKRGLNGPQDKKREERREKRAEKRAPQRQKVVDPRNCLSFQGPGGGPKLDTRGPRPLSGCGFMRVWPQNRLFRLGFGLIRDFSENTSP